MRFQGNLHTDRTIVVDQLLLKQTTFHSDTLIATIGIDAMVNHLNVKSPERNIARGSFPLYGLKLADAYVGIELRGTHPQKEKDFGAEAELIATTMNLETMRVALSGYDGYFSLSALNPGSGGAGGGGGGGGGSCHKRRPI